MESWEQGLFEKYLFFWRVNGCWTSHDWCHLGCGLEVILSHILNTIKNPDICFIFNPSPLIPIFLKDSVGHMKQGCSIRQWKRNEIKIRTRFMIPNYRMWESSIRLRASIVFFVGFATTILTYSFNTYWLRITICEAFCCIMWHISIFSYVGCMYITCYIIKG